MPFANCVYVSTAKRLSLAGLLIFTCGLAACDRHDPTLDALSTSSVKLRSSTGSDAKVYTEVAKDLTEISKSGGRSGASASVMIACSQLGLSDAEFNRYAHAESSALVLADQARAALAAWNSMHKTAKGAESFTVAGELSRIAADRTSHQGELAKATTEKAKVEQEIARLNQDAKARLDGAQAKIAQAAQITGDSARVSAAQGATNAEQAHELRVQAEAERRAGLELQARAELLTPVRDEWDLKITQFQTQLENLTESEKALGAQERLAKQSAADARAAAAKSGERVTNIVRELQDLRAGELEESAAKSLASLKRAVDAGRTAGSASPAQASLMLGMAQQATGEILWSRAAGHGAYAALMSDLSKADPALPASADYATKAEGAAKAKQEGEDAAKAAFGEAENAFNRAAGQGSGAAKEQLKKLAERYARLSGKAQDAATDTAATAAKEAAPAPAAAAPASYDPALRSTLEAFLAANKADKTDEVFAMIHLDNPNGKAVLEAQASMVKASTRLDRAMKSKFNKSLKDVMASNPAAAGALQMMSAAEEENARYKNAEINELKVTVNGEDATVSVDGAEKPLQWRRIDGKWMLRMPEMDEMLAMAGSQMGNLGKSTAAMVKAFDEVASEIESGAHADPASAMKALQTKLMSLMMPGGGG